MEDITNYDIPTIISEPIPANVISILKKLHHDDSCQAKDDENELVDIEEHMIPDLMATDFGDLEINQACLSDGKHEHNEADNQRKNKLGQRHVCWDPDVKDTPERSCSYRKYIEGWHREFQRQQRERKHRYEQMQREAWKEPQANPYHQKVRCSFGPLIGFGFPCDMMM
ncbi:uncharacterized protein LOC100378166 isoform X1 [Saccoglossus kowalevskii]